MAQQDSVTVFDIPSGMGGSFTVSIVEDLGDKAKVRIWHGKATPKGWESWKDFDGATRIVEKTVLTKEREMSFFKRFEDTQEGFFFTLNHTDSDYSPEKVVAKYLQAHSEYDVYRMEEVCADSYTQRAYPVDPSDLTEEQIRAAHECRGQMVGNKVKVWDNGQAVAL